MGRAKADLHGIVNAYALLRDVIDSPLGSNAPRPDVSRAIERPMPGGDALVLAAGGGDGRQQMHEDHFGDDDHPTDVASVAAVLGGHEDDWRRIRREPAALERFYVSRSSMYLLEHLGWAAQRHPEFPDFASDLRRLRSQLERVTGTDERPERGAPCMYCETPAPALERHWTDAGLADDWSCPRCTRAYDPAQYREAVKQKFLLTQQTTEETPA